MGTSFFSFCTMQVFDRQTDSITQHALRITLYCMRVARWKQQAQLFREHCAAFKRPHDTSHTHTHTHSLSASLFALVPCLPLTR